MQKTLTEAGRHPVEHASSPATGPVDLDRPRAGVIHTTEGAFESAYNEFKTRYAPHFLVGKDRSHRVRIVQFVPLGSFASALENHPGGVETNRWAVAQIEVAAFSQQHPWLPDPDTLDALADLLATLHTVAGIPLHRPFPDRMPSPPWATESFSRRHAGKFGHEAGWYGHIEIPENSHWDPGALKWAELLELAESKLTARSPQVEPKPHTAATPPTLRPGASGPPVGKLQTLLNRHGAHLANDHVFGPATERAVRTFQHRHHLPVTGVVDTKTWLNLEKK